MAPPFKDYEEAVRQFHLGIPIAEIARRHNVTRQAMWRALKRRGCEKK